MRNMYRIVFKSSVQKDMRKLPVSVQKRVHASIQNLAHNR